MGKKTLVIGASLNPSRYSNMAIVRLRSHGHDVVALGLKPGFVDDVPVATGMPELTGIDTITMYMRAERQEPLLNYILSLQPKRIIFNPGAENEALVKLAKPKGIVTLEACTLVMLSTGMY
jgi:predicted CoA-binding protein